MGVVDWWGSGTEVRTVLPEFASRAGAKHVVTTAGRTVLYPFLRKQKPAPPSSNPTKAQLPRNRQLSRAPRVWPASRAREALIAHEPEPVMLMEPPTARVVERPRTQVCRRCEQLDASVAALACLRQHRIVQTAARSPHHTATGRRTARKAELARDCLPLTTLGARRSSGSPRARAHPRLRSVSSPSGEIRASFPAA